MSFEINILTNEQHPVIVLKDAITGCEAEIFALGGLLNAFSIIVDGKKTNVIDGFESVNDALQNITPAFKSTKLSPFVCRMNNGEYRFDNQQYKIDKFYLAPHAIHGIVYDAVFDIVSTNADDNKAELELRYAYNATDKGYPFAFDITICWKLEANHILSVTTTVQHNNAFEIPYADGWHPYFTLGASIDACSLQFDSKLMLEFDDTLVPTGKKIKDERFLHGSSLQGIFLDNCFELDKLGISNCVLQNEQLQLTIQPDASYGYLQVYTPLHRKSIAIENLTAAPDAFNNGIGLLLLQPNKAYSFTTSYILNTL